MKQRKRFFGLIAAALLATSSWAQTMTFEYAGGVTASASEMSDGSWLMQLPAGTDLNNAITGVKVNDVAVDAASVTPDPTKTVITDGEIETFVYDGKAYSFRFIAGEYFTAVFFSDPHVDTDAIKNTLATQVNNMVNMNKPGGKVVTFTKAPKGYVATTDIAFCLGDMDEDKEEDASSPGQYYKDATAAFNTAGIPFISLLGNHDLAPDYWTGEDGSAGLSYGSTGGSGYNDKSIAIVEEHLAQAQTNGISDVNVFTDSDLDCDVQIEPFAFKFKGVRFYVGHTYWFQKPYDKPALLGSATYYAPDGVIKALDTYVDAHKDEASVWMQHYPFVSEADTKNARWWLDQNDVGKCIMPSNANSSAYYNNGTNVKYDSQEGIALAKKKRDALATIINKTKNPVHFSGHVHKYDEQTYQGIKDYSVAQPGNAFVVLCKEGVGVIEVQRVTF
ncbi:MAG: metallophosphoesterase [Bacteroidaceae bacterium]|nr:metallophosphoesterase [Bacteroidaceae bacterium]